MTTYRIRHYNADGDPTGSPVFVEELTAVPRAVRNLLDRSRVGDDALRAVGIRPDPSNTRVAQVEIHLSDGSSLTYQR